MSIPVVMVHGGRVRPNQNECEWLVWTLRQAKEYNPYVVLLGGPRMKDCADEAGVGFYDYYKLYYDRAQAFKDNAYIKFSHYPAAYDWAVMERYFVLADFMRDRGLDALWNLDSDVMTYCDLTEEATKLPKDCWAAYCVPLRQHRYRMSASAHTAYFSYMGIWMFVNFLYSVYLCTEKLHRIREKWERWHIRENQPGGVCDMTHLYLFYTKKGPTIVYNLTGEILSQDDGAFEHNIHVSENGLPNEFRMKGQRKEIEWRAGQPYGFSLRQKRWIRFKTLHLQGRAKSLAQSYFWPRRHHGD